MHFQAATLVFPITEHQHIPPQYPLRIRLHVRQPLMGYMVVCSSMLGDYKPVLSDIKKESGTVVISVIQYDACKNTAYSVHQNQLVRYFKHMSQLINTSMMKKKTSGSYCIETRIATCP